MVHTQEPVSTHVKGGRELTTRTQRGEGTGGGMDGGCGDTQGCAWESHRQSSEGSGLSWPEPSNGSSMLAPALGPPVSDFPSLGLDSPAE